MYMCVKLLSRDLNLSPYTPHPISTYIYGVTIVSKMCNGSVVPLLCDCIIG